MEWAWELDDRMSGSLSAIEKALGGNVKGMKAAEKEIARLEKSMLLEGIKKEKDPLKQRLMASKMYRDELAKTGKQSKGFFDQFQEGGGGSAASLLGMAGPMGAIAGLTATLTSKAIELGGAFMGLGKSFIEMAIGQVDYRKTTERSLEATLGSVDKAKQAYAALGTMANVTSQNRQQVMDQFQSLVESGFTAKNAQDIVAAASDYASTKGRGSGDKLLEIFKKTAETTQDPSTLGRGVFDQSSFAALTQLGIGVQDQFLKTIAAQHKVTETQARLMIQGGQIKATESLNAILDITENNIRENGGKGLGFASAERNAMSVGKAIENIKDNFGRLFESGESSPLAAALGRIAALLDPASEKGKKLQTTIAGLFDKAVDLIDKFGDGKSMSDFFGKAVTAAEQLFAIINKIDGAIKAISAGYDKFRGLGGGAVGAGIDSAGKQAVDGMLSGVTGGLSNVVSAGVSIGKALIGGTKSSLDIHSPSRVMMQLGSYTAEGFSMGLDKAPSPDMPAINMPSPQLSKGGVGGGGGSRMGDVNITVNMSGGGDAKGAGQEIAEVARVEILRFLEGMAFEQGGIGAV